MSHPDTALIPSFLDPALDGEIRGLSCHDGLAGTDLMVEAGKLGRKSGEGFYDYR